MSPWRLSLSCRSGATFALQQEGDIPPATPRIFPAPLSLCQKEPCTWISSLCLELHKAAHPFAHRVYFLPFPASCIAFAISSTRFFRLPPLSSAVPTCTASAPAFITLVASAAVRTPPPTM